MTIPPQSKSSSPHRFRVLFLCTGNSCRSQMAEGWTRHLHEDRIEVYSAGTHKHGLNPHAVQVMQEAGVDISHQTSKTVDELPTQVYDLVVTLCNSAAENCPYFPGSAKTIHVPFDDPPRLAAQETDPAAALAHYRRVRDEIREFVQSLGKYIIE